MNNLAANDNFTKGPDEPTPPAAARRNATVTLFQICCLEAMKAIPAQSVHLILADLPYGTTACSWDSIIALEKLWEEYRRIITPTGVIVLTAAQPFTTILAASNLGWLKESLVWEKSRATGFLQSKKRHLKKHEDILVFSPGTVVSGKGRQTARNMTYNPQGLVELEKPVRSRNGNMKGGTRSYSGGHNTLSPIYRPCYIKPNTKRNGEAVTFNGKPITGDGRNQTHTNYPTSILRFASERKTVHPTQKPVALMEYLVRTYSNDGDTVLDNVMGSGTTGVACANVGNRHFIGIERDPKYFAGAEARITAAQPKQPEPAPPVPVAANDDVPAVGPNEHDEIVARVQAIMAVPKCSKSAKVPAWKMRQEARRQTRKVARQAVRAEQQEIRWATEPSPPVAVAVAPASPERHAAANENTTITYATVCSGIEGVSAAVEPLSGFRAEFFSDKAKYSRFAAEFLKWKFPQVPYIDDFTTIDGAAYRGKVDVLWGSTPCQTWSKAGKNAGLADDRGQLTLNFINLVNEIQPQFTIWENVKNVLSHKEAFGQFLGTLAGEDCKLLPAGKKWENAGYVRGPDRQVAWRVFDAEYAGLAARRERVFLIATPVGGTDPRDILWERDYPKDGGRHPEAGRGAWERIEVEKVRLRAAGGGAGGFDSPFAFNADTSPKSSEIGLTLRADTASGGFQGIALRDENGPRAFRLTPEMMERMLGFPPGWTDMGDAWTGRGRLDIRRRAALGNSLAVPDVRWILERVKASVQGTLELHHWPDPDWAVNDNYAGAGSAKVAIHKRGASCGGSRLKPKLDTKFGLGGFEKKFKFLPTEKWDWAA